MCGCDRLQSKSETCKLWLTLRTPITVNYKPTRTYISNLISISDFSIPDDNYWESDGSGMSSYEDEDEIDLKPNDKQGVMSSYYNQMDNELSSTSMAKSFVKKVRHT